VAGSSRRYDANANQVFNWLKEPRFAATEPPEPERRATPEPAFLPVEITEARDMTVLSDSAERGMLEIDLVGGHRLRIKGPYDSVALARLIRGLSS